MKLATLRTDGGTTAVRVEADHGVELGLPDAGAVLAREDWRTWAPAVKGPSISLPGTPDGEAVTFAPPVLRRARSCASV